MSVQFYKNRTLDLSKPVRVYKNLNNGMMSIQQNGKVVCHTDYVTLRDVFFKVNETSRQRAIRDKQRNVHAFACGLVVNFDAQATTTDGNDISYNPFKKPYFYHKTDLSEAKPSGKDVLYCSSNQTCFI